MTNLEVKRSELKYYISNLEYHALRNRLMHLLSPDPHNSVGGGYFIRSLYFDSPTDEALFEKQSGMFYRQKYRMRIYNTDTKSVKFEIKNKHNNQVFKETATISTKSAKRIIDGDYNELLKYHNPILNKIYIKFTQNLYRPKVVVDYTREAYIADFFNIRITFDLNLHSNNTDFEIFSQNLHTLPVILEQKQILEIKYDKLLPDYIRGVLQLDSFERMAISKYALSRRFFKINKWEDN
jgi:hypothetical protein